MNAEAILFLLEENWNRLRGELGDQWVDFTGSYREIVRQLMARPDRENLERAMDEICDLLSRYEFGRGLLRGLDVHLSDPTRKPKSGSEALDNQESLNQVCNRLTELITQERQKHREQEDEKRDPAADKSR